MAEVKPAHDIFKKPITEIDSSSQKPFLAIFFFPSWHTQAMPEFLLAARGKHSNCMSKNAGEERTTKEKHR